LDQPQAELIQPQPDVFYKPLNLEYAFLSWQIQRHMYELSLYSLIGGCKIY
jgi:hypothetical protein